MRYPGELLLSHTAVNCILASIHEESLPVTTSINYRVDADVDIIKHQIQHKVHTVYKAVLSMAVKS